MSRPERATTVRLGAAAASGVALFASREPLDLAPLALVALVPLLWTWRGAGPGRAALYGFTAGAVYHALLVGWVWYFGTVALVPFVAALAGYWAGAGAIVGWLGSRGLRHPLLTASAWVAADAVVGRFPWGGFSWGEVGYAFSEDDWARALASWGGVTLVTFVVVAASDAVATLFAARAGTATLRWQPVAVVGAAVALAVVASATRFEAHATGALRVALLQGNDINRDLTDGELAARTLPRKHFDLATTLSGDYDLVVFPESSLDEDPRVDPWLEEEIAQVARAHDTAVLANAVADHPDGRAVNLNLLYDPDGSLQGTYAKRHLVPFGEFVPFRDQLEPIIPQLDQVPRDFAPGKGPGLFDVAGHRVGSVICFETAFGPLVRDTVRDGAEVVVVSTNNRSYRRSPQTYQHIELSQMRAAETARPVVHASINGVSAVIEPDGDVVRKSELFVNTVLEATVTPTSGQTPYVRYGEWVLGAALLGLLGAAVVAVVRSRSPSVDSEPSAVGASGAGDMSEPERTR